MTQNMNTSNFQAELRVTRIVGIPLKWQGDVSLRHHPAPGEPCGVLCENSDATAKDAKDSGFERFEITDEKK